MNPIYPLRDRMVSRVQRERRQGHKGLVVWMTGLSGSGKSTLALALERRLFDEHCQGILLDGDNLRNGISSGLGFHEEDRLENVRRVAETARLFLDAGWVAICSLISPSRSMRDLARSIVGNEDFLEVFVDAPVEVCASRDVKGLYRMANEGALSGFTGLDAPYEPPSHPDLHLPTAELSPEDCLDLLHQEVVRRIGPSPSLQDNKAPC